MEHLAGTYTLAEKRIQINSIHEGIHKLCQAYRTEEAPDFEVSTEQADIDFEREKSEQEDEAKGLQARHFSDAYLETLAIYRKIAERMPEYDTFLFHGSAIAVDGEAYIFIATSGTGKSTHTQLWRALLGEQAIMVNDDKPLVRIAQDGHAIVYGTPWDGKHHLSTNTSTPVHAICILEQARDNWIRQISKTDAFPMLVQQAYRPADPIALTMTLSLIERLNVNLYRMGCNMDISAAELSYSTMKG